MIHMFEVALLIAKEIIQRLLSVLLIDKNIAPRSEA